MTDTINLNDITKGFTGLTLTSGGHLLEGCVITLHRQNHNSGVILKIFTDTTTTYKLNWPDIYSDQLDRTWKDQIYATEHAAVCLAILLALKLTGYEVIERSVRKTGCDYWIGNSDGILFQKKARLESSGIFKEDQDGVTKRFKAKCEQTNQSDSSGIPAYISVTEFSNPISKFGMKNDDSRST